ATVTDTTARPAASSAASTDGTALAPRLARARRVRPSTAASRSPATRARAAGGEWGHPRRHRAAATVGPSTQGSTVDSRITQPVDAGQGGRRLAVAAGPGPLQGERGARQLGLRFF